MNALGHVLGKYALECARDPLRSYLDECQKNKINVF